MKEILRSNDMVLVSYVQSLLDESSISYIVLDNHMSVVEGSLGILPRRLMVGDEEFFQAQKILKDAGIQ